MSIDKTNIPPSPRTGERIYFKGAETVRKKRSTYCKANAELFRPLFDAVIKDGKEKELKWEVLQVSKQVMYIKCVDALKWLADNEEGEARIKYQLLKANFKISSERHALVVRSRSGAVTYLQKFIQDSAPELMEERSVLSQTFLRGEDAIASGEVDENIGRKPQPKMDEDALALKTEQLLSWKDVITKFVHSEENKDESITIPFELLLVEDKEWICNICNGLPNIDFMFKGNVLHLMRMKI